MKKLKNIVSAFVVILFIIITFFTTSCDDYKSEEFKISMIDSKACGQLQTADSLGADTVTAIDLASIDSTIAVDTMVYNIDSVLVDTTLYFTWTNKMIYDTLNGKYKYVQQITDSLIDRGIVLSNTETNKIKMITPSKKDTVYFALQTDKSSLTFFFDTSVSIYIIKNDGNIIKVSDDTMPLETAAGCTKLDENDVEIPYIKARFKIGIPENNSLLQLVKNQQTASNVIHVSIL